MNNTIALFVLLLATVMLSGCGTIENLRADWHGPDGAKVYGGVENDLIHGREIYGGYQVNGRDTYAGCSFVRDWRYQSIAFFQTEEGRRLDSELQKLILGPWLLAVDLPLSAAADTVLLPYTMIPRIPRLTRMPIADMPEQQ
jgi:uncharacterized protein YceK